jgi:hypothetical protein
MLAIYIDKLVWLPWLLVFLVCCQDHPIAALSTSVMYANTYSEWTKAIGTIIDAQIVCSKCMPTVITVPLSTKFLIDLAAPCCVLFNSLLSNTRHHSFAHPHPGKFIISLPFFKEMMICMTTMIVQQKTMLTMTAIVCMISVTAMSPPPFSTVQAPKEIQRYSSMDWTKWMDVLLQVIPGQDWVYTS